jgi:hypothetical protein
MPARISTTESIATMATMNVSPSPTFEKPISELKEFNDPEDPDAGLSDEEREAIVWCSPAHFFAHLQYLTGRVIHRIEHLCENSTGS